MAKQRQRLVEVPFSKTDCGVDFYINTAYGGECPWVLTEIAEKSVGIVGDIAQSLKELNTNG